MPRKQRSVEEIIGKLREPVWRSWTNTSSQPLVSPGTRLEAREWKATKRPSALMEGVQLVPLPWLPAESRLTLVVSPVWRSRTNTSEVPLVSPGTRLEAPERKATDLTPKK